MKSSTKRRRQTAQLNRDGEPMRTRAAEGGWAGCRRHVRARSVHPLDAAPGVLMCAGCLNELVAITTGAGRG